MSKLSPTETVILGNIKNKSRKAIAVSLGISLNTVNTHIARIKKKREAAQLLLRQTNFVKKELYPKRRGE